MTSIRIGKIFKKLASWMTSLFFVNILLMNCLIVYLRSVLDIEGTSASVEGDDSGSGNLTFEEENAV